MFLQNELCANYLQRTVGNALDFACTRISIKKDQDFDIDIYLSKKEADFLGAEEGCISIKGWRATVFIKETGEYSHIRFRQGNQVAVYYCEPVKRLS